MNICIVGLGLLGGSMSLGLKSVHKDIIVLGVDNNAGNARRALELGIADQIVSFDEGVRNADLVILATPVDILTEQVGQVLEILPERAILTDLGSTKEKVCKVADLHPRRARYVAVHPIAGTENSGPEAAFSSLLKHKMMIICDREKSDPEAVNRLENLFRSLDMRIVYMNSVEHDRHIAYVSHLSHISSFALGSTVLDKEKDERSIFAMAGSGFSSTVRLAKSSPDMWAPIFFQNQKNVSEALDAYIKKLQYFKEIIDRNDLSGSYFLMKEANEIRRVLQGISKEESE
jgi:prephenate dehydrogenase